MNELKNKKQIEEFMHINLFHEGSGYEALARYLEQFGTEGIAWDADIIFLGDKLPIYGMRYNPKIAGRFCNKGENAGLRHTGIQLRTDRRKAARAHWVSLFTEDTLMPDLLGIVIPCIQKAYKFIIRKEYINGKKVHKEIIIN